MLRRLKRAMRLGAFGLIILLALSAAVWSYFDIKWGRDLKAEIAALKDEGTPLRLEDITRSPVPDEQNATTLYQKVFQVRFARLDPRDGWDFRSLAPPGMAGLSQDELGILRRYVQAPQNADVTKCRELLRRPEVQEALAIFEQASRRPECVFPVRWQDGFDMAFGSAFPHLQKAQSAAEIVAAWALLLASEKRTDEALDWCETGLRMCTHFTSEPSNAARRASHRMLVAVGAALTHVLCERAVSPSEARLLDKLSQTLDAIQRAACTATLSQSVAVLGEYYEDLHERPASAYDIVDTLVQLGPASFLGRRSRVAQIGAQIYCSRLARPLHKLDHFRFLRWMHTMIDLSKLPYRDTAAARQSLHEEMNAPASLPLSWIPDSLVLDFSGLSFVMLAGFMCDSYVDVTLTRDVTSAETGMWRVALALKAHKYEHGSYPSDLYSLQSDLQEPLPKDPFSGKQFVYQRQAEGFKLYSIGPDLVDNGGSQEVQVLRVLDRPSDIILACAQ